MEAKAIQQFFPQLASAIGICVQSVSDHCFSKGLIEETTQKKVLELAGTDTEKARILMLAVRDSVTRNPTCFNIFMNILEKILPGVDCSLLKTIKEAMASNINKVEKLPFPLPTKSHTSSNSTAVQTKFQPSSEPSSVGDWCEFHHEGQHHDHALKGAEESDSVASVISEDIPSNRHGTASSELSYGQLVKIADTSIPQADHHKVTFVQYFSHCTLHVQGEESAQGAVLRKMTQTGTQYHHDSNDSSNDVPGSVVEIQGEDKIQSDLDCEVSRVHVLLEVCMTVCTNIIPL